MFSTTGSIRSRSGIRERVRGFIEELIRGELDEVLARPRYGRRPKTGDDAASEAGAPGHRHGSRRRSLTGTFGKVEITVPRARLQAENGTTTEWKSQALRAYQRRTLAADAVIAGAYLAGTNTRRVRRVGKLVGIFLPIPAAPMAYPSTPARRSLGSMSSTVEVRISAVK
jgi:transposase-like protein